MPKAAVPDQEFIELWRTHGSAHKIASVTGIALRKIFERRRRVEQRLNIKLESVNKQSEHYKHLHPTEHSARAHAEVKSGVVLVFSDAHFLEGVRTTAFRALLQLCRELQPVAVVNNGDAFDGASISRHPRIAWESRPTVLSELKACKDSLEIIQDAAGNAKLFWPLGNHDTRFESRLSANVPEFQGVGGFRLEDHFPAWRMCWSLWLNNDTVVKHRYKNGIHATHNATLWAGKTIVTGHLHSLKVTPFSDYSATRWGVDTGTLADVNGPQFTNYLEDSPVNWRSGFVVLTFHGGKLLWPEIVNVVGPAEYCFRGKVYKV